MKTFRSREDARALLGDYSPATAAWELEMLDRLSQEDQDLVLRRVDVLTDYLAIQKPSAADADAAAERLGIKRSNFYRLLARYKQKGALLGISPHVRIKSGSKWGEGAQHHEQLRKLMREHPDAPLSFYMEKIEEHLVTTKGSRAPSMSTLRRWVSEIRAPTKSPPRAPAARLREEIKPVVGRSLLIDQIGVKVGLHDSGWGETLIATFVIDRDSRLIAGIGFGKADDNGTGLFAALKDSNVFWYQPMIGSMNTISRPEQIIWVTPPGFTCDRGAFIQRTKARNIEGVVIDAQDREHGARIFELIGDTFAHHRLQVFTGSAPPVPTPKPTAFLVPMAQEFTQALEDWNVELVRRHEKARLILRGPAWEKRKHAWTSLQPQFALDGLDLAALIDPHLELPQRIDRGAVRSIARRYEEWLAHKSSD